MQSVFANKHKLVASRIDASRFRRIEKYLAAKLLRSRVNFVEVDDTLRAMSRFGRGNFVVVAKLPLDRADNFLSSRWIRGSPPEREESSSFKDEPGARFFVGCDHQSSRGKGNTFISQLRGLFLPRRKICISEVHLFWLESTSSDFTKTLSLYVFHGEPFLFQNEWCSWYYNSSVYIRIFVCEVLIYN